MSSNPKRAAGGKRRNTSAKGARRRALALVHGPLLGDPLPELAGPAAFSGHFTAWTSWLSTLLNGDDTQNRDPHSEALTAAADWATSPQGFSDLLR